MRSAIVIPLSVVLLGAPAMARVARAQVGSPLTNDRRVLQSNNRPGIDDVSRHAEKGDSQRIIKDVKKGMLDADPKVRVASLSKLRFLDSPEATDILLQGLVDSDTRVKIKAIDILGARQVTDAVPVMSQYLFLRSTEAVVKIHLIAALGRIGDERGTLPVMQYLKETADERSRGTAVFALGELGDARAGDVLSTAATEDRSPMVRRLAQEALEKIEGELPTAHAREVAIAKEDKKFEPTDQRLSKLRQIDLQLHPPH